MMPTDLRLYYDDVAVGQIKNAFESDGTWYGIVQLESPRPDRELPRRIYDYISFVEDWNERVRRGDEADASELDRYSDLIKSGLWFTKSDDGVVSRITEAPVFFAGNEVSWSVE
jgi:hypothetical protein